jgi:hypothetical protein
MPAPDQAPIVDPLKVVADLGPILQNSISAENFRLNCHFQPKQQK